MYKEAWIDKEEKSYSMDEISDSHLLNILRYICRGGGYDWFLTEDKVCSLFTEASMRGLKHKNNVMTALEYIDMRGYENFDEMGMF